MNGGAPNLVRRSSIASVGALLLAVAGAAQEPLVGTARSIDGRTLHGALAVTEAGRASIGGTEVDLGELVGFERDGATVAPVAAPHRVWLRSGAELPVAELVGKGGAVAAKLPSGVVVEFPLGTLRALRHGGSERPEPKLFAQDLAAPPPNHDVLYVQRDGKPQRSMVRVASFAGDQVEFELRGDNYEFPLVGTAAVVFGQNTGAAADRQPKPRTSVELVTGERLEGRLLAAGAGLRLRLDEGCTVDVPSNAIVRLGIASDRLVWLSERKPQVDQTPAFDRIWPWYADRSLVGPGLVLGGRTHTRGVSMVPRTRLTYELDGSYDTFECLVGIDDRAGPEAHAVFRVLVDGKVAFESAPMGRGAPPAPVRVELRGARALALEVDFGKNYDLGDVCVFADARLLQK